MSNFKKDLNTEQILATFLDDVYHKLLIKTMRVSDSENQNKGIDIIIDFKSKDYYIDEKSQIHYLNNELPTFAFELSYLKEKILKKGWLFDTKKKTDYYFLVTSIMLCNNKNTLDSKTDIESLKITSVNRLKLIKLLSQKGIDEENIEYLIYNIREDKAFGKHPVDGLNSKSEGSIYFTQNLSEQPINLVLKLNYLVNEGVAKVIYPKT